MQIIKTAISKPEKRINRTIFDPRKEDVEHSVHYGFYTCPKCNHKTRFERKDFLKGSTSKISSFHRMWFNLFLRIAKYNLGSNDKYLDFYCPNCRSPIRIIFEVREFAIDSYCFVIKHIVDSKN